MAVTDSFARQGPRRVAGGRRNRRRRIEGESHRGVGDGACGQQLRGDRRYPAVRESGYAAPQERDADRPHPRRDPPGNGKWPMNWCRCFRT